MDVEVTNMVIGATKPMQRFVCCGLYQVKIVAPNGPRRLAMEPPELDP
jgi:hypothetical protein